ncbi:bis(5'-adenosyl)-triphosphatase ENPP4-like isoform X2 [Phymastichus coffea]|uniref:bis(5'-adenosyl)-triphosphatase ENPP4-like isoform X2 n=1 Tax=Phymastichus coffea TaxID=108790 RepID=UPI00273A8F54|nr:bis(5'-adenosyl)-triphosphatase ENPP4-like isoform X2 [Phymastichus coffea]
MTIFLWCVLILFINFNVEAKPAPAHAPKLLVVSYDAFRYDYFERNVTPFLKDLRIKSTYTDYMRNVFVTKTFPNHFTISTGLFVETHGVVDSEYYDPKINKTFKYSHELFHYNNDILPIWILNENADGNRHSGIMMWPGGDYEYDGKKTIFHQSWNTSIPWKNRIDDIISWFNHPKTPINFGMLYIEEPDFHGHGIGINNPRFNEILKKLDEITKYLHQKLKQNCLTDVNVIHLSDHGMSSTTINRIINLTEFIDPADYKFVGISPVINIYPIEGKETLVYTNLKKASTVNKNFDVYLKEDIPERYHFHNNPRIGPILVVAKIGYAFQTLYDSFPWYEKEFNITINENSEFGVHGYDNNNSEMHPFFFGLGPAFLPACKVPPFDNTDLLPLFCEILDISCPQVNGTLSNLKTCLTKHHYEAILYNGIYIGGVVISILGIIALFLVYLRRQHSEKNTKYRISSNQAAK